MVEQLKVVWLETIDPNTFKILAELKEGEIHHIPCDSKN